MSDNEEIECLLREHIRERAIALTNPELRDRDARAMTLLGKLARLDGKARLRVTQEAVVLGREEARRPVYIRDETLHYSDANTMLFAKVDVTDEGVVVVITRAAPGQPLAVRTPVDIEWNPITKQWEGTGVDTFHTPEPGKPVERRRDALAVLVEAVLAARPAGAPNP